MVPAWQGALHENNPEKIKKKSHDEVLHRAWRKNEAIPKYRFVEKRTSTPVFSFSSMVSCKGGFMLVSWYVFCCVCSFDMSHVHALLSTSHNERGYVEFWPANFQPNPHVLHNLEVQNLFF